jgi:GT2 family glycosyltransferase
LLLNPDLEFGPGLFAELLSYLERHSEYAIAGPGILEGPSERPFPRVAFIRAKGW